MKKFCVTAASLALMAVQAGAVDLGQINEVNGKVLVSSEAGFVPAVAGAGLAEGTKVMIGAESFASIAFENCALTLDRPMVFTVTGAACEMGATAIRPVADAPVEAAASPLPLLLLGVGGAAVVGGAILLLNDDDDDDELSEPAAPPA
jgi:hypothetical protein